MARFLDLVCLDASQIEKFEKSSEFLNPRGKIAHTFTSFSGGHRAYLFDGWIDKMPENIDPRFFLYLTVNDSNCVGISGQWVEGAEKHFEAHVCGSMSIVIEDVEDQRLLNIYRYIYSGDLFKKYSDRLKALSDHFCESPETVLKSTLDFYNEDKPRRSKQVRACIELAESALPSESLYPSASALVHGLWVSYIFFALGAHVESPAEKPNTLICSLDGTCPIATYVKHLEFLKEEISDLQYDLNVGYSLWTEGTENEDLYEQLEINNAEYVSYPTIYAKGYQAEPESGYWYKS